MLWWKQNCRALCICLPVCWYYRLHFGECALKLHLVIQSSPNETGVSSHQFYIVDYQFVRSVSILLLHANSQDRKLFVCFSAILMYCQTNIILTIWKCNFRSKHASSRIHHHLPSDKIVYKACLLNSLPLFSIIIPTWRWGLLFLYFLSTFNIKVHF